MRHVYGMWRSAIRPPASPRRRGRGVGAGWKGGHYPGTKETDNANKTAAHAARGVVRENGKGRLGETGKS